MTNRAQGWSDYQGKETQVTGDAMHNASAIACLRLQSIVWPLVGQSRVIFGRCQKQFLFSSCSHAFHLEFVRCMGIGIERVDCTTCASLVGTMVTSSLTVLNVTMGVLNL